MSVMEPPGGMREEIGNVNVKEMLTLPAMRSEGLIVKWNGGKEKHNPLSPVTKWGEMQLTGARNVRPLCSTAASIDGLAAGALALSVTTISTADTTVHALATEPSLNSALHAAPVVNGLPVTVRELWDASSTWGVTLMMTGAWASRSGTA